jgi:ketosteroid isomerase-like protein
MTSNKDIGLKWFTSLISGDQETVMSLMAEDFRYFLVGTMPSSGWWDRQGFFESAQAFSSVFATPITMRIGEVTTEGDRVWMEAESEALLTTGATYNNTYVFLLKVRDGKVVEAKEFSDTLQVFEAVDRPETRGARKPRQSPLTTVTDTVRGPAAAQGIG